jgi:superfamily I DNA/RNA helicase
MELCRKEYAAHSAALACIICRSQARKIQVGKLPQPDDENRKPMPQRQMFCAAYRCGKTQRLVHVAREALAAGVPASQIAALTVHRPAANVLRDMLRDVTGQSVPTTTLRQRALTLLQTFPAAACLPPGWSETEQLSGIDRRRLVRQAWASAGASSDSLFARRGHQPGAIEWVALLFDRFSEWSGTADPTRLPQIQPDDRALAELWHAYCIYLQLCRRHQVVAFNDVFNRAIDVLRDTESRRTTMPRMLLLDDIDLFHSAELLFATALIAPTTDVYAAATAAPRADSALALERLLHRWTATHQLKIVTDATMQPAPALTVGEYTTPDAEAHAIARHIAAQTCTTSRYDDIALVAFDAELVPLLQRVLPQYGVPVQGQAARDGYTLALAPLALAGLKLLAGQALSRAETITLLRQPALALSSTDARAVVEAVEQQRFQPFDPGDQRWLSALSTAGRERLTGVRAITMTIRATSQAPSAQLQSWLTQLEFEQRAWAQTTAALEPWAVAIDRRHWTRLLGFLRQAETLSAALHTPLTPDEAIEVFTSAQALITPEGQPQTNVVQIWQPSTLGGCTARLVFAAGLHEGALPQPQPPLPFADDAALAAAFGTLPGFVAPQLHDRAAAWERAQHDLQRTIGRALDVIHLSYSRTDRQGRTRLASPVVAATIDAQIDRHGGLHSRDLSIETALPAVAQAGEVATWPQRFVESTLIAVPPPLPVHTPTVESPFVISPSAIEDYFTCPRRCFYARMLGLYDIVSSPRQALGHVVHNALNDLLHEARDGRIEEARARGLVARHWLADDHRWGSRLKQTVFRQLAEQAVAQLARYQVDHGTDTMFVGGELRFHWQLPDTDIIVSGRIDRIDRSAAGLHVIDYKLGQQSPSINELLREFVPPRDATDVADWRPGDIQLPVYALALEQGEIEGLVRQPHERVASVALIYPLELYGDNGKLSAKGRREIALVDHGDNCPACNAPPERSPKTGTLCRAQLAAVATRVHQTVAAMRAAAWQPDPREGSQTCAGCVFRPICSDPQ